MDKFVYAVRKYLIEIFSDDYDFEPRKLHVHYVDTWNGFRLYDNWIEGRFVDPVYPPRYIMASQDFMIRWMTEKEAWEYQKNDECMKQAVGSLELLLKDK